MPLQRSYPLPCLVSIALVRVTVPSSKIAAKARSAATTVRTLVSWYCTLRLSPPEFSPPQVTTVPIAMAVKWVSFFLQNTKHHGRRISKLFKSYSAKSIEIWISIQTKDRIALERETNGWKVYSWRGHGLIATVSFCHLEVGWHMMFFARGPCCHATSDWDIVIQSSFYLPEWQQRQSELHAPPPLAEVNLEPCCCLHHCCCGPRWQHFHRWELHRKQHLNLEFASRPGRETCTCCWLKPSLTNIWVPPPPMIICYCKSFFLMVSHWTLLLVAKIRFVGSRVVICC